MSDQREDDAVPEEDPRQTGVADQMPEENPEGQGAGAGRQETSDADDTDAPDTSSGAGPESDPGKATGNPDAAG